MRALWLGLFLVMPALAQPTSHVVGVQGYGAAIGGLAQGGLSGAKPWVVVGTTSKADWRCAPVKLGSLCAAVSNGIIVSVQRWCPAQAKGWGEECTLWSDRAKACPSRAANLQVRLFSDRLVEREGELGVCVDGSTVGQVVLQEPGATGLLTGWSIPEEASFALTFLNQHIPGEHGPRWEPVPVEVVVAAPGRVLPHVEAAQPLGAQVTGPMDALAINRVLQGRRRVFRACASPGSATPDGTRRRVQLDFGIDEKGEVTSAVIVASDLDNAQVERCLLERTTELGFGPRDDEAQVRVRYTLDLATSDR